MINFSGISDKNVLGKLLRLPLKFIPKNMIMPILQGKLKGKKWIVGSGNHGCWLGSYEYDKQRLFSEIVTEGSVVYDIGAHVGFYTLLASVLVGPRGKVIAFEPLPKNIQYLKEHLKINQCNNVEVIEAAVSSKSGKSFFIQGGNTFTGYLSKDTEGIEIEIISLDDLINKNNLPIPHIIKIDVEGAELEVLKGAKDLIATKKPTIFLSVHTKDIRKKCHQFLKMNGYNLEASTEGDLMIAKK